jgi:hypothetical protein
MWELVSLYPKSFLTDGNALSTGEYPFETGEEEEKKNEYKFLFKKKCVLTPMLAETTGNCVGTDRFYTHIRPNAPIQGHIWTAIFGVNL